MNAIGHAMTILGWFEHLGEDDMPPVWMWHLTDELERHFTIVKERRMSNSRSDRDDDETAPMIRNEYARGRGREAQATHG
jgi:hypothetical protein